MMNVYVTNLTKYNEGKIVGEWISLPVASGDSRLQQIINEILRNDEEIAIHNYECDFMEIGEYDNIFYLNEIAEIFENMEEHEKAAFKAFKCDGYNFEEALKGIQDGDFSIWHNCQTMEEVAIAIEEEIGLSNETYDRYIDIEALARDIEIEYQYEEEEEEIDFIEYAENLIDEGCINDDTKRRYFDYEAFGRDLEIEGNFIFVDGDCVELF